MKTIREMTKEEKIGQLVWIGFKGSVFNDELKYLIDTYKAGNIVLFSRNIHNPRQLFELNKEIHDYVFKATGIMPFIAIDQEGGMVVRITEGATFCPGNMTLATASVDDAYAVGRIAGEELRALGINFNLAPSLDVNNNPDNPVIGVRSYSDNPLTVAAYGGAYLSGLQSTGVIATTKHFPGHGDTETDSHKALAAVRHDRKRLENLELVPFKKTIGETKAVMTAHLLFPAYEPDDLPATLSPRVIKGLLRDRLGFKGLIISDCMEMKAIDDHYTTERGCLLGLRAGLDQVMVSATFSRQVKTFALLTEAYDNNELLHSEVDRKLERIMKAKEESYPIMKKYFYDKDFNDVKDGIGSFEHQALAARIADESLTLVRGKDFDVKGKTLIIAVDPFPLSIAEEKLNVRSIVSVIKEAHLPLTTARIDVTVEDERIATLVASVDDWDRILVCTYDAGRNQSQAKLVNSLFKALKDKDRLWVLSTRSPYDLFRFRQIKNYLCLYEYTPNTTRTIVRWLKGEIKAVGRLPVILKEKTVVGASLYVGLEQYPLRENLAFLDLMKEEGIGSVFISAHLPEMKKGFTEELTIICKRAAELGIDVSLDVTKTSLDLLRKESTLPSKGFSLRLDGGFDRREIAGMCYKRENGPNVEINASTVYEEDLLYLQAKGIDLSTIRISHNFYPKKGTGLSSDEVIRRNRCFHELGMRVAAFIPSHFGRRPPLYEGLPTVESHRDLPLYAVLSTIRTLGIDEIFFGDAYASREELRIAKNFDYEEVVIPIVIADGISEAEKEILRRKHRNRRDINDSFVRSSSRVQAGIAPFKTTVRNRYDVTVDNEKFGRYQGEVGIMKKNLPADERVNVVGRALINELVLKAIGPDTRFRFIVVGEDGK